MILSKADNEILRSSAIINKEFLSGLGVRNLIRSLFVGCFGIFWVMLGTCFGQVLSSKHIEIAIVKCYWLYVYDLLFWEMEEEFVNKSKRILKVGGIAALVLSILISLFLYYLYKFSFLCFDTELCNRLDTPMIQIPWQSFFVLNY